VILTRYCYQCGTALQPGWVENRVREVCPNCGWIHYEQLKMSAGCRIQQAGKLLLVQRQNPPFAGCWHFPSGYAEVEETPQQTAQRETFEESGLQVSTGKLAGIYFYSDDPRGNGVVVIYDAQIESGEPHPSPETTAVCFFSPAELSELPLAGMSGTASVADWLAEQKHV
jgi:ADP-ribose pyrophosphatase YjhB (NUDIX family)